jgi:hypothetical protein
MLKSLDSLAVFGINPEINHQKNELGNRLDRLKRVLIETAPRSLIFLGGDTWTESDQVHSEAGFLAKKARLEFPELLPQEQIELPVGRETMAQTHALLEYMSASQITSGRTGLISTWHQLLRSGTVFMANGYPIPEMYPILQIESPIQLAYDISLNALAGAGYTLLAEILKNRGFFRDGGPVIRKINQERANKDDPSWFNTLE